MIIYWPLYGKDTLTITYLDRGSCLICIQSQDIVLGIESLGESAEGFLLGLMFLYCYNALCERTSRGETSSLGVRNCPAQCLCASELWLSPP